jgi:GT2 family glycosyltransferase
MSILYAIPTLNQLDWVLDKHIPSIDTSLIKTLAIHTSEFIEGSAQDIRMNSYEPPKDVEVLWTQSTINLGVAASWNLFLGFAFELNKYDGIIIANDDIILGNTTLQAMLDASKQNPEAVVSAGRSEHNAFSLFYIPEYVYRTVGLFDERFYPAYFEDNDYAYRMKLKDVPLIQSAGDTYYHKGSATINTYTPERMMKHHESFRNNQLMYVQKWGGVPGKETFTA